MENIVSIADNFNAPPLVVEVTAATRLRLDELDRLRAVGMAKAMELDAAGTALSPSPILTPEQHFRLNVRNVQAVDRIVRAVRHIMALEFELLGLFEAPDRDALPKPPKAKPEFSGMGQAKSDIKPIKPTGLTDLRLRPDYRNGPMEDVVAGIRKTLGVEAPPNDPFAPRPERKARKATPAAPRPPSEPAPATVKLPEKAEANPAMKAAILALSAKLGNGFRIPPAKPRTAKPNPARPPKRRRNRGPPK
jgi:hypothetical protein